MRVTNAGQTIVITAKESYTRDELFTLLKEKLDPKFGAPELKKILGIEYIAYPGADGFDNLVSVRKNRITMSQVKSTAKGMAGSAALNVVTDGWSNILNLEGKANAAVMKELAEGIELLTTGEVDRRTPVKSRSVALALAILFGILGVDRFYLGYKGLGVLKLLTLGGFLILWLVDLFSIITGRMNDKAGNPLG